MRHKYLIYLVIIWMIIVILILTQKKYQIYSNDNVNSSLHCVVDLALFQGKLWAAAYGEGLYFYDKGQWHKKGGINPHITCLAVDGNKLWYGTWMEGLIGYIDRNCNHGTLNLPIILVPRPIYRVQCIAADQKFIWVGTQGYLLRYSKEKQDWDMLVAVGEVNALSIESEVIWVGTSEGLIKVMVSTKLDRIICTKVLSDVKITSLSKDEDVLWIGGLKKNRIAIWQYFPNKKIIEIKGSFQDSIVKILVTKTKIFFIEGSKSFGINNLPINKSSIFVYNKKKQICQRLKVNLNIKDIKCILWLKGKLWVGGIGGVQQIRF